MDEVNEVTVGSENISDNNISQGKNSLNTSIKILIGVIILLIVLIGLYFVFFMNLGSSFNDEIQKLRGTEDYPPISFTDEEMADSNIDFLKKACNKHCENEEDDLFCNFNYKIMVPGFSQRGTCYQFSTDEYYKNLDFPPCSIINCY